MPNTCQHNYYTKIIKDDTHPEAGICKYECVYCGDSYTENIPSLSVSVSDLKITYKKSGKLTPTITADTGVKYTVTYTSSNPGIVSVDNNGNVQGVKKGSATITVTVTDEQGNKVQDTCTVTVKLAFWQVLIKIFLFGWIWY